MLPTSQILFLAPLWVLAEEGSHAGNEGLFSGFFADAVWTVVAFVALLLVLGKLAWKPMLGRLKEREQHIQQQIDAANTARRKAEEMLDDFKKQGANIVKQATDQAQQRQEELVERAQQEVLAIKQKAQADIEYARTAALERLWNEAGEVVLSLSEQVLQRAVTSDDDRRLVRDTIEQMRRQPSAGKQT
jgi:F-type H+-transporting ATPase subunit b